ncbi:AAA family ATPase [Candidatus Palauibacter sp.]|uniref:AAA family ATPase n=1 Tax=Candidatus Palauibacter sp. TaxID=3101350 RepID=UPI003B025834
MRVLVIAGPNGAGKTTFARRYLRFAGPEIPFVNGDIIAAELNPDAPDAAAQLAGRIALERMESYAAERRDFAFETTLSGRAYARRLIEWREQAYRIGMVYLRLPSADHVVRRVAQRVSEGGHDIPEPVARRRFERSWRNFLELYRPVANEWQVYDTSGRFATLVAASDSADILPFPPAAIRIREVPTATRADAHEGLSRRDHATGRDSVTKDATHPPDRFPEGEPSIRNVTMALMQARDDALARAEAVRRREAEAARADKASSAIETRETTDTER